MHWYTCGADGSAYGHVITKISGMHRLPNFITSGALHAQEIRYRPFAARHSRGTKTPCWRPKLHWDKTNKVNYHLQSNQVKRTPQESNNEFIIQKLNQLLVVDFRLISAFLYV